MNGLISKRTLTRLPVYLSYLKSMNDRPVKISAAAISKELQLNHVLVRKDLAAVGQGGRPRTGYITENLIGDIERFMGYKEIKSAVIVGAGKLGTALLDYEGFSEYGIEIVAAFDMHATAEGKTGKPVYPMNRLQEICSNLSVHIAVVTVPAEEAQPVADILVDCGISAIWNFAPVHLNVPETVLVQNENMGASLALLSKYLKRI
ncbi:MAG: redox-sensing transcriptional repressor Rex [Eubacteriales bacterium]